MEKPAANRSRLVKNSVFMYIRMFILLLISLYTSRILLKELGINDYGIYNLVGSVIAMFSSLRSLFASSTQRFMSVEIGKGNREKLNQIFCISIYINILLSLVFVTLVEILGIWFFTYKINVSPDRLFAAQCVFQLSLASAVVSIMTTPYDASIIANERMDFYAFASIVEGLLKLLIVFLLGCFRAGDKLILYGILLLCVQVLVRLINSTYCKRNFSECKLRLCWNREVCYEMTSFAGWQFFGNTAFAFTHNGMNIILNIFGGPVVNAARGIAMQVNRAIGQFLSNITIAVTPHCMVLYAKDQKQEVYSLLFFTSKVLFTIQCCISVPLLFLTDEILSLWLTTMPEYTTIFLRIVLIWSIVRSLHSPLDILFKAAGKIRDYQITEGLLLLLPVLLSYLALSKGMPIWSVFAITTVMEVVNLFAVTLLAAKVIDFPLYEYYSSILPTCFKLVSILSIASWLRFNSLYSVSTIILIVLITVSILVSVSLFFCLSRKERNSMMVISKSIFKKR